MISSGQTYELPIKNKTKTRSCSWVIIYDVMARRLSLTVSRAFHCLAASCLARRAGLPTWGTINRRHIWLAHLLNDTLKCHCVKVTWWFVINWYGCEAKWSWPNPTYCLEELGENPITCQNTQTRASIWTYDLPSANHNCYQLDRVNHPARCSVKKKIKTRRYSLNIWAFSAPHSDPKLFDPGSPP